MASNNGAAYFIGGQKERYTTHPIRSTVIAKFYDEKWSLHGNLQKPRSHHGSITFGGHNMVVGGLSEDGS